MAKRKRAKKSVKQSSGDDVVIDSSVLFAIGDELDAIEQVLEMVPGLTVLAHIVTGSKPSRHAMFHDEFADSISEKLGINIDAKTNESAETPFSNLCDIPNTPDAVLEAARWRLRRVSELLEFMLKS